MSEEDKTLHWNVPLNEEYLSQTNDDIFDVAQKAVNLAHDILTCTPEVQSPTSRYELQESALKVLSRYADIHKLAGLPGPLRRKLYVENYGESEVQGLEEIGEVKFQ